MLRKRESMLNFFESRRGLILQCLEIPDNINQVHDLNAGGDINIS
jgi:hypothetical protein